MPRNGSGIYFRPAGIDGIPDHSIESAKYNLNVADVETDLNTPRPIVAGGTGATTAAGAMAALGGELAEQAVTNYDSFPFLPGSFWSAPGATSEPFPGNYAIGICYVAGLGMFLEARMSGAPDPAPVKVRQKSGAGVWGPWVLDNQTVTDAVTAKVNRSGDTMTGDLEIHTDGPNLTLNATGTASSAIVFDRLNQGRWTIAAETASTPETGGNAGSDLIISRFSDVGIYLSSPLTITRVDGRIRNDGTAPASPNELSNKAYVDSQIAALNTSINTNVNAKVAKAGDTMTGPLTLTGDGATLTLNTTTANVVSFNFSKNSQYRWITQTSGAESSGNAGSNFYITAFGDTGGYLQSPLIINRATGNVSLSSTTASTSCTTGALTVAGGVGVQGALNVCNTTTISAPATITGPVVVGTPTGGPLLRTGTAGTINAQSVYDDGALLTCAGTQFLKFGEINLGQWDAVSPTGRHDLAHQFVEMVKTFDPRDHKQYIDRMLVDEALPGMPTAKDWKHGHLSLGELHNRLWLATELLASAFVGLRNDYEQRLNKLIDRIETLERAV